MEIGTVTADEIVRRLARINWIEDEGGPECFFCRRGVTYGRSDATDRCDHADDCEFALALAYVDSNPG